VWNQEKVKTLIESFNKQEFVPPVTIGAYTNDEGQKNLILDGQQRLTSIFLAYLDLFPKKECRDWAPKHYEALADTNDDVENEEDSIYKGLEWNFNRLLMLGRTKAAIKEEVKVEQYDTLKLDIGEDFFKNNYLGFSFIVPSYEAGDSRKEQIKFYSSVFRHINIQGEDLSNLESRRSLYFLNRDLESFFDPKIFKNVKIKEKKLDFVRYLALLNDYEEEEQNENKVAVGKKRQDKLEQFFVDYVYRIVENGNFEFSKKMSVLKNNLDSINDSDKSFFTENFQSIIDADVYLFGLIYFSIFKQKNCTVTKLEELKGKIDSQINDFKKQGGHQKSPGALKYLRERLKSSIELYKEYFSE